MAGPIRIAILANGRQARTEAALTARAYDRFGRTASRAGKLIAGAFAVTALVRAGAAVERVGATYVNSLNKIQALTGANGREIDKAAQKIEGGAKAYAKMGQTAGDAAAGVVELTKSGLSLKDSLAAVRSTMVLAKAGELDVADASTLVANTINTFSLKAKDASRIANGLANAANISSADVTDLAESFKYASPLAAKAGLSLDQVNAILAELSNSGIKASQAGTSLRGILLALQAPSTAGGIWLQDLGVKVYGAGGKMRDFGAILADLRAGIGKLSEEDQNFALKSIFGKNSITGASVLLKNGKKGLDEYTKGVQRAGAAQKLANAASKGLDGTLKSIKASSISTAQSLYRQYSPALNAKLKVFSHYLADNQDEMIATGIAAGRKLEPALASLADLAKSTGTTLKDSLEPLAKVVIPALVLGAKTATGLVDAFNGLPGPIKSIAVQAGVAALVFPRLASAVSSVGSSFALAQAKALQFRAELTYTTTRAQQAQLAMSKFSSAARGAAGIGGLVALSQGAESSSKSLQALGNIGGGALLGFSLGGPVGGAIGASAGALLTLSQNAGKAGDAAKLQIPKFDGLRDSLDGVTAASTELTRQTIQHGLAENGTLQLLNQYGISSRTAVSAILGETSARKKVGLALQSERVQRNAALKEATKLQQEYDSVVGSGTAEESRRQGLAKLIQGYKDEANAHDQIIQTTKKATGTFRADVKAKREEIAATKDYSGLLKGLPKSLQTKIKADGIKPTMHAVLGLAAQYKNLDRKQIRTVLKAAGLESTRKQIDAVRGRLDALKNVKPNLSAASGSVAKFAIDAKRRAMQAATDISGELKRGTGRAKPNLVPFQAGLNKGLGTAKSTATSGGNAVGHNLQAGILAGFAGTATALANQAAAAVNAAVAAARRAGDIHSPSRKMDNKVGRPLGEGLIRGFVHSVTKGKTGVSSAIDRLVQLINGRLDGKKQAARRKSLLKSLDDEKKRLIANGKRQDENNKKLDKAREKYKGLVDKSKQYAAAIKAGFLSFGSVAGLGTTGDSSAVTLPALLSQLAARAGVAQQFTQVINGLRHKLNKTSLKQILAQAAGGDIEGALATAQAIASGGASAIAQINALTAQITKAGSKLGDHVSHQFYGAGIKAADALVDRLKRRQKELDKTAVQMADKFVDQVRKGLGAGSAKTIHPPATHVSRTSALDTYMRQGANVAPQTQTVKIRLSAHEVSQLQRGKEIQADLDVFRGAGGRSKVRSR